MRDRAVYLLAVAAAVGAWWGSGPPVLVGAAAVAVALLARRPILLCVALALLVGGRAQSDRAGLADPPVGTYAGWVVLTSDPVTDVAGVVHVDVRAQGRLFEASGRGDAARALAERSAGDRVAVHASLHRPPPGYSWLARRHIVGLLTVDTVGEWADGSFASRVANASRDALDRSSLVLPDRQRGLYLGLVVGDDRDEPADIADDFRAAGLAHLLAVSGQNVAFVLALAGPLLRRLRLAPRFGLTLATLGLFVLVTRAEPSVLRAATMAAVAALAHAMGREASGLRVLALSVAGLLVADPFLVDAVGFRLSVAASAAILLLARPIAAAVPGPRALAEAIGVSTAAQIGVAPLLVSTFGGVPVAGLLANVLAAPAAGPVMAWGVLAGLAGGALGAPVAAVLHVPTTFLVGWLAFVAERTAALPLGQMGSRELVVLGVAVGMLAVARRASWRALAPAAVVLFVAGVAAPGLALHAPKPVSVDVARGATLWRDEGSVLVLTSGVSTADVLAGLRTVGAPRVDLVVVTRPGPAATEVVAAISARAAPGAVVTADAVTADEVRTVGRLAVHLIPSGGGLIVDIGLAG